MLIFVDVARRVNDTQRIRRNLKEGSVGETRFESVCEAGSGGESGGAERGVGGDLSGVPRVTEWIS
jgi:hypothetical protein